MRFCDQVMRDVITESRGVCHDFFVDETLWLATSPKTYGSVLNDN